MSLLRTFPCVLLLLAPLCTRSVAAAQWLQPFSADYLLSLGGIEIGKARLSLRMEGDGSYVYESKSRASGTLALLRGDVIEENSRFRSLSDEIIPLSYAYTHNGSNKDRDVSLLFDWPKGEVRNTAKGGTWTMPIPPGTLDKLSLQLALAADLKQGLKTMEYLVADGGRLKRYRFTVLGEELLETALGSIPSIKLNRSKNNRAPDTTIWLLPSLRYLPARIERHRQGVVRRMVLQAVRGILLPAAIKPQPKSPIDAGETKNAKSAHEPER